eukprot:gene7492-8987_t
MNKLKPKTPKRSTTKAPIEEPEAEPVISHGQNLYHLGAEIGKGGFAVVFQAFNAHTGQTVAVKRFPLSALAGKDSQLSVEMAEIELMHELDHPHIVKYYDTVKTKNFLYIVLEYMENGSLANVIKKFGILTEALAAIYIAQVLRGLKYLHDQGVLHRDIKGANILTSKDGLVKLADFGVAIKINSDGANSGPSGGMEDNPDLAGSPYWMAPEIIEMSTPTSACDIWSVGCVVIELLTSKPPYFDMDPMSALFRIVSDDYPPFPEGISQALKDFLLQCFHKEPSMRSSAEKLLGHPWLGNSSSKQSLVQTSQMLKSRSIDMEGDVAAGRSTEVIQSAVRMYERGLNTIPEGDELSPKSTNRSAPSTHRSTTEPAAAWPELTLTGSASLPGSNGGEEGGSRSRSRSHSGSDDDTVRRGDYNSDFALSGESNLSSVASTTAAQISGSMSSPVLPLAATTGGRSRTPPQVPRDPALERSFDLNSVSASSSQSLGIAASFSTSVSPEKVPPTKTSSKMAGLSLSERFPVESGSSSSTMKSLNSSGSFLQGMSMKMVSEDSFDDINNWELELSASRDSAEGPLARKTLARNTLTTIKQVASPNTGHALKEPYLINLNSQTLSFVATEGDKAPPAGPTPVVPAAVSSAPSTAPANTTSAGLASKKVTIPLINIPKLAMPPSFSTQNSTNSKGVLSKPNSGLSLYPAAGEHSHHSSIDLNKYQEDNSEDDFGEDFEPPESARERAPVRFAETTKGGGFAVRTASVANNGINDDDFEGDFMFEGGGLHDRIKAFKETATADLGGLMSNRSSNPSSADSFREDGSPRAGSLASATPRGANLASHLRKKIALVSNKDSPAVGDEDLDAFINYQYDEKDFKQNEAKDLHYRRSREIVEVMNRIRLETKAKEVVDLCNQLLAIFSEVPEQRDHLITHHGVMPIVDMFDARAPTSYRTGAQTGKNTKALYVLKVVNKIIDGSIKAKEQLSLVGIIPTVMNLFEGSFRHAVYHHPHHLVHSSGGVNAYTSNQLSSSTSSDSSEVNNLSPGINVGESPRPPLVPQIFMREDLDPLTLEAARFLHQISSTSSLTLQMLIGAGGLSVLTSMVSLGATFTAPGTVGTNAATAANNHSAAMAVMVPSSNTDSRSPTTDARAISRGIASIASNFSYDFGDATPVTDQQLADDPLFSNKPGQVNVANVPESEDAQHRMTIFQMGVDCVTEVFAMKASRSRDFCRLFAKLGLLQPLSLSFQNVLGLYRARQMNITNVSANATTGGSGTSSSTLSPRDSKSSSLHLRRDSSVASPRNTPRLTTPRQLHTPRHGRESSGEVSSLGSFLMHAMHQDAEESQECKYAHRIAQLFFTFSRSDAIVAETMVKAEHCVLHVMLTVLQAPELRTQIVGGRITPSTSMAIIGKGEVSLSSASLSAHNASHSASSPNLFRRTHGNLLPTYVEIVDLLLKCLKNLSMEPSALADLEAAGTLDTLVPLLSGPISDRCKNHILPCIFNMCRVNKRRQERVAWLGLVPHLKKVITDGSPLRQFALPILFDLAHTSAATRAELCKWSCLPFYLDLLKENYWQAFALNSIAVWMANDTTYVAGLLVETAHLSRLIDFFRTAPAQTIHTLHRPLLDMMFKSPELCKALGLSRSFASALVKRLKSTDEAIVLRSLLKMLQLMHEIHDSPKTWVETNKLEALVEEFAKSERKVLVRQLAKKLLLDFKETTTRSSKASVEQL